MRHLMIAALMLTAVPALADRDHDDRDDDRYDGRHDDRMQHPVVMDRKDLREELDQLSDLLDKIAIESSYKKRRKLVARAREQVDNLRRDVREAPTADRHDWHPANPPVAQQPAPPPPPPVVVIPASQTSQPAPPPGRGTYQNPPQGVYAIGAPQLAQLDASMRREAFGRDRLRVLDAAARSNYFTVAQVQQLLPLFDFSNDRLQAVRLLRPRIMDMQNSYLLYGSFQFSNEKTELKRILGQ